jgi:hypothetical protein
MDLMKMNLLPYVCAWAVLGVIVMVLATAHVAKQEQLAKKLAKIELWGKSATLVLIVTGVVLGLLYGWQMWEASSTAGLH